MSDTYQGFTYSNVHSSAQGVYALSINRTISPALRKNEFVIPGRHGTLDYGMNTYDKRLISVRINLIKTKMSDLRKQARDVAQWLSKSGTLIFDDEKDKVYQAKVYSEIDIEQIATRGVTTVIFECQPFAESLEYNQVNQDVSSIPTELELEVKGTAETPCIITIKNIGTTTIQNISITRKAAI